MSFRTLLKSYYLWVKRVMVKGKVFLIMNVMNVMNVMIIINVMNIMNVMNGDIEFSQYSSLLHNQKSLIFKNLVEKYLPNLSFC